MKKTSFFGFDVILFIATIVLMISGILFIYSSGLTSLGEVYSFEYVKQIVWAVTGIILLLFFSMFNYNRLRGISPYAYLATLLLLIITVFIGREVNGAKSWIGLGSEIGIQPSEFMKISTILFLAGYFSQIGKNIKKLRFFLLGFGIVAAPVFIIMLQPDMGTALVFIPIFIIMAFLAGAQTRYIVFVLITAIVLLILIVIPAFEKFILGEEFPIFNLLSDIKTTSIFMGALLVIILFSIWGYFQFV